MMHRIASWLTHKWRPQPAEHMRHSYEATFKSLHGQLVLQHLLDNVYCQVYEGTDPHAALVQNARRSVIHEILQNIDMAEHPEKYHTEVKS